MRPIPMDVQRRFDEAWGEMLRYMQETGGGAAEDGVAWLLLRVVSNEVRLEHLERQANGPGEGGAG